MKTAYYQIIMAVMVFLFTGFTAYGSDYFVSTQGNDANSGTITQPFKTIKKGLSAAAAGDTVYLRSGAYSELITFPKPGSANARITLKAYDNDIVTVTQTGQVITLRQPYITIENLILDGNWGTNDIVKLYSEADYCILKGLEIKQSRRDAVDLSSPEGVLIENCKIHDAIWFEIRDGVLTRDDAHGIVTEGVKDLTIRDTEIYYVSGDALQFQYNGWNNITVENCKLWNAPLPTARAGAPKGANIGENAVDTKFDPADGRGRLVMKNITAYGWRCDYIVNAAAFNIKHNVEVVLDGITVYDSEIAFRLRGPGSYGGAWVTVKNAVVYGCDKAVRYEDKIENLHLYNMTFGGGLGKFFESAGGYGKDFQVKNCVFLGSSKPVEASGASNLAADASAFINASDHDYRLVIGSPAIDKGVSITDVTSDRAGVSRPQGSAYDVGAYEFINIGLKEAVSILKILSGIRGDAEFNGDVTGDKQFGLQDAISILQMVSNQ